MLTGIRVGNFKAFGQPQSIPIKPITLIFGPNSGGKSSIIHSLLLLSHAIETGDFDVHHTELGGESVDLGGFKQFIHKRQLEGKLELGVDIAAADLYTPRYPPDNGHRDDELRMLFGKTTVIGLRLVVDLALGDTGSPQPGASPHLRALELLVDGTTELRMSRREGTTLRLDRFNSDHLTFDLCLFQRLNGRQPTSKELALLRGSLEAVISTMQFNANPIIPSGRITDQDEDNRKLLLQFAPDDYGARSVADFPERGAFVRETIALLELLWQSIDGAFRELLRNVQYIGPLRPYLPRHVSSLAQQDAASQSNGTSAWDVVRTDTKVRELVNKWLGNPEYMKTPYRLVLRTFVAQAQLEKPLWKALLAGVPTDHDDHDPSEETNPAEDAGLVWEQQRDLGVAEASRDVSKTNAEWLAAQDQTISGNVAAWRAAQRVADEAEAALRELQAATEEANWEDAEHDAHEQDQYGSGDPLENLPTTREELHEYIDHVWSELQRADVERVDELVMHDMRTGTTVSHRDIGVGVSQVLPVLVGAYAHRQSTIIIEQPELHLHPALQTELADVFIHSALGEQHNTFIIETHSEHLILRLMRRLRDTSNGTLPPSMPPVRPEDIAILYVDPMGDTSIVQELQLGTTGELLSPWPGGFFEEAFDEAFA